MGKLEERESRRRSSVIGSMVDSSAGIAVNGKKGRPKENRELKKRVSLSVLPSLYEDIQKIAYVQRRSVSDVVGDLMEQFRAGHEEELAEYRKIVKKGQSNKNI